MNASSIDIKDMLEADSELALTFGTDLHIGREPAKPVDCVTIFDTQGFPPQINLTSQGYEYPSVQIRVRGKNYEYGWEVIERIKTLLHGRAQETWNNTIYTAIACASGPTLLDWDDNGNPRFIINFNIQRVAV